MIIIMTFTLLGVVIDKVSTPGNQKVHAVNSSSPFAATVKASKVQMVDIESVEAGKQLIEQGKATLVLEFPSRPPEGIPQTKIQAFFDPKEEKAQVALRQVQRAVEV
ncbi:MAG: hypothetical protein ABL962_03985, partial [Fimbriimonadaceae bacterium]